MLMGGIGLVTGAVVFNPRRIDWSVGEGRVLGGICAAQGFLTGAVTLVFVLQLAASMSAPPALLPLPALIAFGGMLGIFAVGRRHDARNPSKRYWSGSW